MRVMCNVIVALATGLLAPPLAAAKQEPPPPEYGPPPAWQRYRELADGNFNHTSALVLLDAKGRIVARTEQVGAKPDPEFVKAVRAQL